MIRKLLSILLTFLIMLSFLPSKNIYANVVDPATASKIPTGLDVASETVSRVVGLSGGKTGILYYTGATVPTRTYYYRVVDTNGTILFTKNISTIMEGRIAYTLKVYAIAEGKTVVTWEGTSNRCDSNTNDMFQFIMLDVNGNIIKNKTDISTQTAQFNCNTDAVELSDGNIAFIWQHAGNEYFMRILDANGNSVTQPTSIDKTGSREALSSYDSTLTHRLAANKNGSFMIVYYTNNSKKYYGVLYNNDGTQKTVNGFNHFILLNNERLESP